MANAAVSRIGQTDGSGATDDLFLKVFSGEVLTTFREKTAWLKRHMVRSISSGKSAQFPATHKASASYHTPGEEIVGQAINHNERIIVIDDLLISDVFIAEIDEAMNHYDVRSEYSYQLGSALAQTFDKNVAQVNILAARGTATVSGGNGGTTITDADADTSVDSLIGSVFDAAQALDEKDVPEDDRFLFVKPDIYYQLVQDDRVVHSDFTAGSNGGLDTGMVFRLAGFEIVKTNNLPSTNVATGPAAYQGDFSNTVALCSHRSAAGTVKLLDLATEMGYDMRRQGTLIVSKYALGHGILRPEAAVEIATA